MEKTRFFHVVWAGRRCVPPPRVLPVLNGKPLISGGREIQPEALRALENYRETYRWSDRTVYDFWKNALEGFADGSAAMTVVFINYACNKLYRTALVRPAIRFPEGVRRCEDAYFAQDCLLACRSIAVCPDKLYHYEQHEGSALHRFYTGVCRDELPLMERQHTLFHPAALTAKEERAYRVWEYGKVLAVCRYIRQYAPDRATRKAYLQRWVTAPAVWHALKALPPCLGRKATVLNLLTGLRLRRVCIAFLEYLCQ